jgi:hypothetical protein
MDKNIKKLNYYFWLTILKNFMYKQENINKHILMEESETKQ